VRCAVLAQRRTQRASRQSTDRIGLGRDNICRTRSLRTDAWNGLLRKLTFGLSDSGDVLMSASRDEQDAQLGPDRDIQAAGRRRRDTGIGHDSSSARFLRIGAKTRWQ